ncbi:SPRY domain-containing protein 3-like isoform X1 [Haliotis rubra]|uniref:SPRY domain-containing protein 3-like isoform X1 n=1 Tax=Haliotis rubra TaxID=36100 RepID=UPI001EE54C23|nr:SPRY domain-containing protein 3-like isoform X1 [Haliotis rubra]XP_046577771.1 SPRY domain-containing protein 3-like isoform X1 [Haliotis rubra]
MAAHNDYHYLHCREMAVDQRTGELRYETSSPDLPVAQIIGPKPLSRDCHSFSIEIAHPGMHSYIAIGVCNRHYPAHRQPGWKANSVGYHADDGGIYFATGSPINKFGRVGVGEMMGCSLNFQNNKLTFFRNGNAIYTSPSLSVPPGGFYPVVGLHSHGERVTLLEREPWTPNVKSVPESEDVVYHSLFCREARVSHSSGTVSYDSMSPDLPVGQFVSECPLSPICNRFSIEIAKQGQSCCISIGVCHRRYPGNRQPGWLPNSIGYHADDGGIFHGRGHPSAQGPPSQSR